MSSKTLLITHPDYEITTRYLAAWAKDFINEVESKKVKVLSLYGDKVTKKRFHSMADKMSPDMIFLNGHGDHDCVTGHNSRVIVGMSNVHILKNSITYALSCHSGLTLGSEAVKKGAKSYIGYKSEFIFFTENGKTTHPLQDEAASLFLDPSSQIARSLVKGRTVEEAVKRGRKAFSKSIVIASSSEVQKGFDAFIPFLRWDRKILSFSGDAHATV